MSTEPTSISDPTTSKPPRRKRWIPLSVRMFAAILLVLFVGGGLWIGVSVYRKQLVNREIEQLNGIVNSESDAPLWLTNWVNQDWLTAFDRITDVKLPFSETLDANTTHLLAMRPLPRIFIDDGPGVHQLIRAGRINELRSVLAGHRLLLFSRDSRRSATLLHVAVLDGEFDKPQCAELVKFLLEQGSEVDGTDSYGATPLSLANDLAIVKLLIDHGANLAAGGPNDSILEVVAFYSTQCDADDRDMWLEISKLLRAAGAKSGIVSASCLDDPVRVRQLLEHASRTEIQDALRAAAFWGRTEIVKILLDHRSDSNGTPQGELVVFESIRHPDVLEVLFDRGVSLESCRKRPWKSTGWTLLHEAAASGAVKSAELLLKRGLPVDIQDDDGWTPLHVAATSGRASVVKLLLDHQANLNAQTSHRVTAISYASSDFRLWHMDGKPPKLRDRREVIELLLAAGAPPDLFTDVVLGRTVAIRQAVAANPNLAATRDFQGDSPLDLAVKFGELDSLETLLAARANIDERAPFSGWTALHHAADLGNESIVRILVRHLANVDATDENGRTPLHWAAYKLRPQIVRLLLEAGANPDAEDRNSATALDVAEARGAGNTSEAEDRALAETIQLLTDGRESAE